MRASTLFLCLGMLIGLCFLLGPESRVSIAQSDAAAATLAQASNETVYLPLVVGRTSQVVVPGDGATALTVEHLGEKVPVEGATKFFEDTIFNSTGDLSIWIPPNAPTVRGILFHNMSPVRPRSSDPDWRNRVAQERKRAERQIASMWGFAYVSGMVWRDDIRKYEEQKELFHAALDEFAQATGHDELRYAPLVIRGESRTAGFGASYAQEFPERVITYVMIVAGPKEASSLVPGLMIVGERDKGETKINDRFVENRAQGGLFAAAMMWKVDHKCDRCGDLAWPYMDQMIRERLPSDVDLSTGPVTLNPMPEQEGWLGDIENWGNIYPYDQYPGDKSKAAWFPNSYVAHLWRHFVRQEPPAAMSWPTQSYKWSHGFTQQPAPLFKKEARDISASKPIKLVANLNQPVSGDIHFYDGDIDLGVGVVSADGKKVELSNVQLQPGMHSFTVMQGDEPIAWPAGIILLP